jgi:hypothetical protein
MIEFERKEHTFDFASHADADYGLEFDEIGESEFLRQGRSCDARMCFLVFNIVNLANDPGTSVTFIHTTEMLRLVLWASLECLALPFIRPPSRRQTYITFFNRSTSSSLLFVGLRPPFPLVSYRECLKIRTRLGNTSEQAGCLRHPSFPQSIAWSTDHQYVPDWTRNLDL